VEVTTLPSTIQAHLDHLLQSPHFRNSRRCQSLLRFTVEHVLQGRADELKERLIGVMAFGREPAYDTSQDAVVRNVATDVRKRLAQYYLETGHSDGLRIELPLGSYIPEFVTDKPAHQNGEMPDGAAVQPGQPAPLPPGPQRHLTGTVAIVLTTLVSAAAGIAYLATRPSELDRFWAPMSQPGTVVQICVGRPFGLYGFRGERQGTLEGKFGDMGSPGTAADPVTVGPKEIVPISGQYLWMRDAFCMARLAAMLEAKGIPYRLRGDVDAPYSELRGSPLIMIGSFDWRQQIRNASGRRFRFNRYVVDGTVNQYVEDLRNPADRSWKFPVARSGPPSGAYEEYGIITRTMVSAAERVVVSIVGGTEQLTVASGELLVNAKYLAEALKNAPSDWDKKNLQLVVRTKIIQGAPGPPSVVALHTW
jgi:hypothetical protein